MIDWSRVITPEQLPELKQGNKVSFKWYGSDSLYTGRIEVNAFGILFFVNEFEYNGDSIIAGRESMKFYNSIESFKFFTQFDILG